MEGLYSHDYRNETHMPSSANICYSTHIGMASLYVYYVNCFFVTNLCRFQKKKITRSDDSLIVAFKRLTVALLIEGCSGIAVYNKLLRSSFTILCVEFLNRKKLLFSREALTLWRALWRLSLPSPNKINSNKCLMSEFCIFVFDHAFIGFAAEIS